MAHESSDSNESGNPGDPVWDTAWSWVRREYDGTHFDAAARIEMVKWMLSNPAHRDAYDKAARLWLVAGLVPPVNGGVDDAEDEPASPEA